MLEAAEVRRTGPTSGAKGRGCDLLRCVVFRHDVVDVSKDQICKGHRNALSLTAPHIPGIQPTRSARPPAPGAASPTPSTRAPDPGGDRCGAGQAQGADPAAAEAQDPGHGSHGAGVNRRIQPVVRLGVRGRLCRAAVRSRDGPRGAAATRGHQGERADVHPVSGRSDLSQVARRKRAGRSAGGTCRAGARNRRRAVWSPCSR